MRVAARRPLVAAFVALAVLGIPAARASDSADMKMLVTAVWGVPDFHSAHPGGTITFNAEADNEGPGAATNVTISIPVTHFLQALPTDYSGTTCTSTPAVDDSGTIACTAPSVAAGHYMEVQVTLAVPSDAVLGSSIETSASVSSDTPDPPDGYSNHASGTTTIVAGATHADLTLGGSGATAVARPGGNFAWNIQAYDSGPDAAVHVSLIVPLTAEVTLVSATPQSSWPNSHCGSYDVGLHGSVICTVPVLLDGTGATSAIVLHVAADVTIGRTLHLAATVSSDTADANADNDTEAMDVYVGGADLDVTATGPETATMGTDIAYTMTISNDGPEVAVHPTLRASAPWETDLVNDPRQTSGPAFTCQTLVDVPSARPDTSTYTTTCTAARLAVGASARFELVVHPGEDISPGDTISFDPVGWSDTQDSDSDDNSDTVRTMLLAAAPAIDTFDPVSGIQGTAVTIAGSNFTGTNAVSFGGTPAASFTVNSDSQITAVVGAGSTGTVRVTTPSGTATGGTFRFFGAPTVTDCAPDSGGVHATVTMTGTNFTGATAVTLNGTPVPFTVVSATKLTFTVPAGATSGRITVTTPGGDATSADTFDVLPAPTITSISPGSGPIGTVVTITGTNLLGTVGVRIGSVITVPTSVSPTQVVFTIPPGAVTGPVKTLSPAGSATSPGAFVVTP